MKLKKFGLFTWLLTLYTLTNAQCPNPVLYDLSLTNTGTDINWTNCIDSPANPDNFVFNLISPNDITNYTVNFGDGSPIVSGAILVANTPIVHTYTQLGTFTVTLTSTENGCTTTIGGTVINDRKPGASALPPTLGSSGCVPHSLTFKNQTTNTSPFTTFTWDWGNGEEDILDHTNAGQDMSHTYQKGTAGCDMTVKITATSLCATSFSEYGPYDFWDIDTAVVTASEIKICSGEEITFTDNSLYNCNVTQPRKIKWNFSEVGGIITPWLAAVGDNRNETFFVNGNIGDIFTVTLADSNYCGVDVSAVSVEIIAPPSAQIAPINNICAGSEAEIINTSTGGADTYIWNFGDGKPQEVILSTNTVNHVYDTDGTYTITLIARSGLGACSDTTTQTITVLPSSISNFTVDNDKGCGNLSVNFTESSTNNPVSWEWDFGTLGSFSGQSPTTLEFNTHGTYEIELTTKNNIGCGIPFTKTINIYPEIIVDLLAEPVCVGDSMLFLNQSELPAISCATGEILYEKWNNISGNKINNLTQNTNFPNNPSTSSLLNIFETTSNQGNNFGDRIYGFVCPPMTGNYTFYISSDDHSELYLSPNGNPNDKELIASVNGNTKSQQWTKFASQISNSIFLVAGQKYYIEAIHKEGGGNDHLAVGWTLPNGNQERPIPGSRLSPYQKGNAFEAFTWNFGDGSPISTESTPKHLYNQAGNFTVNFTASTGVCNATKSFDVLVNDNPVTNFELQNIEGCTPLNVTAINKSSIAKTYIWTWNDGSTQDFSTSPTDTIKHIYFNNSDTNQTYFVQLVSLADAGCSDTLIKQIDVFHGPIANFIFDPSTPQCSPVDITFKNLSIAATDYEWNIANEQIITQDTTSFTKTFINQTGGLLYDTLSLKASSGKGCSGTISKILIVYPEPDFKIISLPDSGCHPLETDFFATGSPVNFQWNFGDGISSTLNTPKHTFNNLSQKDTTFTVQLIGSTFFNCKDTVFKDIKVFPKPIASFSQDLQIGCPPLSVNFKDKSIGNDFNSWTFGDGQIDQSTDTTFIHIYENTGITPKQYDIEFISMTNSGCSDTSMSMVTVYPEITADFNTSDTIGCSPLNVIFENQSTGYQSSLWNFGGMSSSLDKSPTEIFNNQNTESDTLLVNLIVTSQYNCIDSSNQQIIVHHEPKADFTVFPKNGCSPLKVTAQNFSLRNDSSQWIFSDTNYTISTLEDVIHPFENNSFQTQEFSISLLAKTNEGCSSSKTEKITLFPQVKADISVIDSIDCSPLITGFNNNSINADKHTWELGDGTISNLSQPTHVFKNFITKDTIYNIRYFAQSIFGCTDSIEKQVTVHYQPTAQFTQNIQQGCTPLHIDFENLSDVNINNIWKIEDSTFINSTNTISYTFNNSKNTIEEYNAKLIVSTIEGCADSVDQNFLVYPTIDASIEIKDTIECSPLILEIVNNTSNTGGQYLWDFGDGSVSNINTPNHTFKNFTKKDTTFVLSYVAISKYGCTDTTNQDIHVLYQPTSSFFPSSSQGCSPLTIDFTNQSNLEINNTWVWNDSSNTTSTDSIISFTYNNTGGQTINTSPKLIVSTDQGCSDTLTQDIQVFPPIEAKITFTDTIGCSPFQPKYTNDTDIPNGQHLWDFGDGKTSILKTPTKNYINFFSKDTSYTITYIAVSKLGCSDTLYQKVDILYQPTAFFIPNLSQGCSPLDVIFNNKSDLNISNTWVWNDSSNTTSTDSTISFIYNNTSGQTINVSPQLIVSTDQGCSDTLTQNLQVFSEIKANITFSDTMGCAPFNPTITNNTIIPNGQHLWNFGDGKTSILKEPNHEFNNYLSKDTTFILKYTAKSLLGCEDSLQQKFIIHYQPVAKFNTSIQKGCSPLEVTFINESDLSIKNTWNLDSLNQKITTDSIISFTYNNVDSTTYTSTPYLKVQTEKGCKDSTSANIDIYPKVTAQFSVSDTIGCGPLNIKFLNTSANASNYIWLFGDNQVSISENTEHIYENYSLKDSIFISTLIASSNFNCKDTTQINLNIYPKPNAEFIINQDQGCSPLSIDFANTTQGKYSAKWIFNDSNFVQIDSITTFSFTNQSTNSYSIYNNTLIVENKFGCSDTTDQNITVYASTLAKLTKDPASGCTPLSVNFTSQSENTLNTIWDFGDAAISTIKAPTHTYKNFNIIDTTYFVELVSFSDRGCSDTLVDSIIIHPIPLPNFLVKTPKITSKDSLELENFTLGDWTYTWDMGNGQKHQGKLPPTTSYKENGFYTIELTATNENTGCTASQEQQIEVILVAPTAAFTGQGEGCGTQTIAFTNQSTDGIG